MHGSWHADASASSSGLQGSHHALGPWQGVIFYLAIQFARLDFFIATKPYIVGIGGTVSPGSSTENALAIALASAERNGASVRLFDGPMLAQLPHYAPGIIEKNRYWAGLGGVPMGLSWAARISRLNFRPVKNAIKSSSDLFAEGRCMDDSVTNQLQLVGRQVVSFATRQNHALIAPHATG